MDKITKYKMIMVLHFYFSATFSSLSYKIKKYLKVCPKHLPGCMQFLNAYIFKDYLFMIKNMKCEPCQREDKSE